MPGGSTWRYGRGNRVILTCRVFVLASLSLLCACGGVQFSVEQSVVRTPKELRLWISKSTPTELSDRPASLLGTAVKEAFAEYGVVVVDATSASDATLEGDILACHPGSSFLRYFSCGLSEAPVAILLTRWKLKGGSEELLAGCRIHSWVSESYFLGFVGCFSDACTSSARKLAAFVSVAL